MFRPDVWSAYDPKGELPLGGYAILVAVFTLGIGAGMYLLHRRGMLGRPAGTPDGRWFLEKPRWPDFALLAIATHQLSWMIGRDRVLSPFRALFARYESSGDVGELNDAPRGEGILHAIGDLVTCPYCLGPWVAGALLFGFVWKPRPTRFVALLLTLVAFSNLFHQGYTLLKHANGL